MDTLTAAFQSYLINQKSNSANTIESYLRDVSFFLDYLKQKGTPVSKPTAYRYLGKLCEKGVLRKFSDSKSAAFQYIDSENSCHEHMHLKCLNCGEFIHLGCDFMSKVDKHIFEHHNFKVDNSKTVILGLCEKCTLSKG